jgi:ribonuclease HII
VLRYEEEAWQQGWQLVAGVDEAGRGPLAGPVVAAAVVWTSAYARQAAGTTLRGLTDSKKLTARRREFFYALLTTTPQIRFGLGVVEADEIDAVNILRATHRAMAAALEQLDPLPDWALVDGRPVPGLPCASRAIVRGDALSLSIAAASVVAKVTRDRLMQDWDRRHPVYGFARHKGYGTAAHLAALAAHGPAPCHRRSFAPVRAATAPPAQEPHRVELL